MNTRNVLNIVNQHHTRINAWYDQILIDTLTEIKKNGFFDPRCHALSYSYNLKEYNTTVLAIPREAMIEPKRREVIYNALQNIEKTVNYSLLGLVFASEGKNPNTEQGYMIITFEDRIKGWKNIYTVEKQHEWNKFGQEEMRIIKMEFNDKLSYGHAIPELEKFSHILRPNYFDKKDTLYN